LNIWDKESFEVDYRGKKYKFTQLGIDISESWNKPNGTVEISHKIESDGLTTTIYIINDFDEGTFGFGHKVIEDGKDYGLFVTLQDEVLFEHLASLVNYVDYIFGE
jgi:hypothetical protein